MAFARKNKFLFGGMVALSIMLGVIGPVLLLAQTDLVNRVDRVVNGQLQLSALYVPLTVNFILMLGTNLNLLYDYLNLKISNIIGIMNVKRVRDILQGISYAAFEDSAVYDKIKYLGNNNIYESELNLILQILRFAISSVFYIAVLARYSWVLPAAVFAFVPVTVYFSSKDSRIFYKKQFSLIGDERAARYKAEILRQREYAKEVRIYHAGKFILADWEQKIRTYNNMFLKNLLKYTSISKGIALSQFAVSFLNLLFVLYLLCKGDIGIAAFVVLSNHLLGIDVIGSVTRIADMVTKIKHINEVTDELSGYEVKKEERKFTYGTGITIEFRNVFFNYPNSGEPVLKDVSFKINSGESYVLVGENGAGKSTVIKLMLGLYQPVRGEILINGVDIKYIPDRILTQIAGCTFQDYAQYALSLKENIGFDIELGEIRKRTAFLDIDGISGNLEQQYETLLGKTYGNALDLSGGQWQKIAIARAFADPKDVMIFDEPTAALDPVTEIETFKGILENSGKALVLLVTHRLGISTKVDKILVLDNGTVAEYGDFGHLMEAKGKFYELFESQRQLYVRKEA